MPADKKAAFEALINRRDVLSAIMGLIDPTHAIADKSRHEAPGFFATRDGIVWQGDADAITSALSGGIPADTLAEFHLAPVARLNEKDTRLATLRNVPVVVLTHEGAFGFVPRTWNGGVEK